MSNDNLKIVESKDKEDYSSYQLGSSLQSRRVETTAKFEKRWRENPTVFNPLLTAMGRSKINRTEAIIESVNPHAKWRACDLGAGSGIVAIWMTHKGIIVDAVDISSIALERLKTTASSNLNLIQDYVPFTKLNDDAYDLVVCTDLIAELHTNEHRVLISELARLVKQTGYVVCSTPVDVYSEDALQKFYELLETEFIIINRRFSYHRLYIAVLDFLTWPAKVLQAENNPKLREDGIEKRHGFSKYLFQLFSSKYAAFFPKLLNLVFKPLSKVYLNSDRTLSCFESITRYLWQENGISHAIFSMKRKTLLNEDNKETPHDIEEPKHKRFVWE